VIEQSLVGAAREAARRETARRVAPLLTPERCRRLDGLLEVDTDGGTAKATWLRHFPGAATPGVMHDEMDKLVCLRALGAEGWDQSALPPRRVAILARWAQAASNQALAQSSAERRYPALLAFGAERLVGVVDGLVDLFDKLLADTNAKARSRLAECHQAVATAANDKVLLLARIVRVLLDPDLDDDARVAAVLEAVPKDRLAAALADCERIARPADARSRPTRRGRSCPGPGCPSSSPARTRSPVGSGSSRCCGGCGTACGRATCGWRGRVATPTPRPTCSTVPLGGAAGRLLRRRRAAPSGPDRLAQLGRQLDAEVASFAAMLEAGEGPVRLDGDRLVVGRDTGDDLPASVERLKGLVLGVLPEVELTEVVIALDAPCGFSKHLLHSAGAKARSPAMLTHLYAAILAQATSLGPVAMAPGLGLSYDQVAHATAWYLREETLVPAIDEVINYHHGLAASRRWATEERALTRKGVELVFIVALQHLPPNERAALLMRDVLDFSAKETAAVFDATPAAVNSALQRARASLGEQRPERSQQAALRELGDARQRDLVQRYSRAMTEGNVEGVLALLTEDATWSMPPSPDWYTGHATIAGFLVAGPFKMRRKHQATTANGQPAVGVYRWDDARGTYRPFALDVLELRGERIAAVTAFIESIDFANFGLPPELA